MAAAIAAVGGQRQVDASIAMYAVFRENTYPADLKLAEHPDFQEFQRLHADRPGYAGTVVAEIGDGRYLSITM